MKQLSVTSLGQIADANLTFGDMTVLVGPQASGKSIFLQLVKLVLDFRDIARIVKQYGFYWQDSSSFLSLYFGEGMQRVWNPSTRVLMDQQEFNLENALSQRGRKRDETVFLIPAQRVVTLKSGWPRPFTDYETGDPYVVKQFSEHLRQLMEAGLGSGKEAIFPQRRINKPIRDTINQTIFYDAKIKLDSSGMRKRLVLQVGDSTLPFMAWSAGQREFFPLLLGLYWLLPPAKISRKANIEWVIIEEPEMGLHSQAISAVLLVFLELMHRGYKVIVSTHSPQVLELVWAIQHLCKAQARPGELLEMFGLKPNTALLQQLSRNILEKKTFKTFYFDRQQNKVHVKDISELDPASPDAAVSDWGGLTTFSTRVSEIVSQVMRKEQ